VNTETLITDASPAVMRAVRDLRNILCEEIREETRAVLTEQKINPNIPNGFHSDSTDAPYLDVKEAAKLARLGVSTLRVYIRKGQLKPRRIGRKIIISRAELDRFLSTEPT